MYFFKLSMLTMTAVRQFGAVHSPLDQRRVSPPPCAYNAWPPTADGSGEAESTALHVAKAPRQHQNRREGSAAATVHHAEPGQDSAVRKNGATILA